MEGEDKVKVVEAPYLDAAAVTTVSDKPQRCSILTGIEGRSVSAFVSFLFPKACMH